MKIQVVKFNPNWEKEYDSEAKLISELLKDILVDIYHIGSTSVKNLASKPIIDIMVVVDNIDNVDKYNILFRKLGYECMGEYGIVGRRYFRKGGDNRTHHIHVFDVNNKVDIQRHLAFRDYLAAHNEVANEYGALKIDLARKYPNSIEKYCNGKEDLVIQIEKKALEWYENLKNSI